MSDIKLRATLTGGSEFRSYPAAFEVRTMAGSKVELSGYASTVETPYKMYDFFGEYTEIVRAGAFAVTLAGGADVSFLANHAGMTMARTKNGTLSLSEDATGLLTVATLNTARSDARDLVTAVEDGDVTEMSFAFRVVQQQWSPDYDERALVELNLDRGDVSAVNYGANSGTSLGIARAFRSFKRAQLHRIAVEVRAGKALSAATLATLAQVLDLISSADDMLDQAQPLLADLAGLPNPDADDPDSDVNDPSMMAASEAKALAFLDTLRRRHVADGERRTA